MKVTFILIVLAALLGYGLVAAAQAASAPEPVAAVKADEAPPVASTNEDPQPTLLFRRVCWTGNVNNVYQPAYNQFDVRCLSRDGGSINWSYTILDAQKQYAQQKLTMFGNVAVTVWEKIPNPEP